MATHGTKENGGRKAPNYTITRFLYLVLGFGIERRPARVPRQFKLLVRFAEEVVGFWEQAEDQIRETLGHDNFRLVSVDVFEDEAPEIHWELLPEPGPFTGRCHLRFLPRQGRRPASDDTAGGPQSVQPTIRG